MEIWADVAKLTSVCVFLHFCLYQCFMFVLNSNICCGHCWWLWFLDFFKSGVTLFSFRFPVFKDLARNIIPSLHVLATWKIDFVVVVIVVLLHLLLLIIIIIITVTLVFIVQIVFIFIINVFTIAVVVVIVVTVVMTTAVYCFSLCWSFLWYF